MEQQQTTNPQPTLLQLHVMAVVRPVLKYLRPRLPTWATTCQLPVEPQSGLAIPSSMVSHAASNTQCCRSTKRQGRRFAPEDQYSVAPNLGAKGFKVTMK